MTLPLVSVVVPVFDAERYLRESLDSILAQTYENIEVIVMDDASSDGSAAILDSYVDGRLRAIRQSVNRGIFDNLNDGIREASGDLIAFFHADDVYHPRIIEREVALLVARPKVGAVFCTDIFIDPDGREFGRLVLPKEIRDAEILRYEDVLNGFLRYQNSFIRGQSSLIRKEVYETVGLFDGTYSLRADLDMWLRIASRYPIAVLDKYLVWYRYGHENSSKRYDRLRTDPEIFFSIMDRLLASEDRALAEPDALTAYEGHRAADHLILAVNEYILGNRAAMRTQLRQVRARRLLATSRIQRGRLLVLLGALRILVRLPRFARVGKAFRRHWHEKDYSLRARRRFEATRSGV